VLLVSALLAAPGAWSKKGEAGPGRALAPVKKPKSVHAPFEMGSCSVCHERDDPKHPGKVQGPINALCLSCHEGLKATMEAGRFKHAAAEDACTNCHNPHGSKQDALLLAPMPGLCTDCHGEIAESLDLPVKHAAVTGGDACANCHNPHASQVEKLLAGLPYDLCLRCHGVDGVKDTNGKELTNFKGLLADNPVHHEPVADKDCSACHQTHGSTNFRLLVESYPAKFYAPFSVKTYALCFGCHDEALVTEKKTTTATRFRDGDRNLHYLHVNKVRRGRTCRACHEVHASPQPFQIRDGVPFGSRGWVLKLHYEKAKNGGSCAKTCHAKKTYSFAPSK